MTKQTQRLTPNGSKKAAQKSRRRTVRPAATHRTFRDIVNLAVESSGIAEHHFPQIRAIVGIDGYCKRPLSCDGQVGAALKPHLGVIIRREMEGAFAGRTLVKIEVADDSGVSPISSPLLRAKTVIDRGTKMLAAGRVEGVAATRVRPCRDEASGKAAAMALNWVTLGFAPPGTTAADLQTVLRRRRTVSVRKVPDVRVTEIDPERLDAEIARLINLPTRAATLTIDEEGCRRWKPLGLMSPGEALRQLECLEAIPMNYFITGVSSRGRAWAAELKGKVMNAQRARVDKGLVLDIQYDTWATLARARASLGDGMLSVRTDIPMKLVPAVPKPKTMAQRQKADQAKAKRRRGGRGLKQRPEEASSKD